jgi:N-carbamoyl-L-amino-acid hydrolase
VAVAELALYMEQRAAKDGDSVGTIGQLNVPSGSINVVPGALPSAWTCAPHRRPARCAGERRAGRTGQIAQRRGLRYTLEESMRAAAAPSAPACSTTGSAPWPLGVPVFRMPSGAGTTR